MVFFLFLFFFFQIPKKNKNTSKLKENSAKELRHHSIVSIDYRGRGLVRHLDMIRLKAKKAEQAAEAKAASNGVENGDASADSKGESEGVKLLGIGGKSASAGGAKKSSRRNPGEIRIQKGTTHLPLSYPIFF